MGESFGTALAQAMKAAGFSQATFAQAVKISQGQLSRILNAERRPPLRDVPRWLNALGVPDSARSRLLLLADLAHAPPRVAGFVERLVNAVATARRTTPMAVLDSLSQPSSDDAAP